MKLLIICLTMWMMPKMTAQKINNPTLVYLIPGQGADTRMFKNIELDSQFDVHLVDWLVPEKGEDMRAFAHKMATQIDTSKTFILVGVSLGGMIVTEMCDFLKPQKAIVISSAKCRAELPLRYKFMRYFPINRLVPGIVYKQGSLLAQPIVEPDRNKEKETCIAMLKSKNPKFLKRTIEMIINWNRVDYDDGIIHVHGNNDHTLPIKKIDFDYCIEGGSHMMTLTEGGKISKVLNEILAEN